MYYTAVGQPFDLPFQGSRKNKSTFSAKTKRKKPKVISSKVVKKTSSNGNSPNGSRKSSPKTSKGNSPKDSKNNSSRNSRPNSPQNTKLKSRKDSDPSIKSDERQETDSKVIQRPTSSLKSNIEKKKLLTLGKPHSLEDAVFDLAYSFSDTWIMSNEMPWKTDDNQEDVTVRQNVKAVKRGLKRKTYHNVKVSKRVRNRKSKWQRMTLSELWYVFLKEFNIKYA